ncbi:hypothetical protein E2C01_083769 [Portunus trituberculatus]|uniref:Uncharacterized protein n=1 Tax=Portunus trituberculatus TaxID=210409 RepID=A0A5B7J4I1_PORTR|nr:hypothetical protein [Portunus trituberculatus]
MTGRCLGSAARQRSGRRGWDWRQAGEGKHAAGRVRVRQEGRPQQRVACLAPAGCHAPATPGHATQDCPALRRSKEPSSLTSRAWRDKQGASALAPPRARRRARTPREGLPPLPQTETATDHRRMQIIE